MLQRTSFRSCFGFSTKAFRNLRTSFSSRAHMSSENSEKYPSHLGPFVLPNGGASIDIFPHVASSTTTAVVHWSSASGSPGPAGVCIIVDPCADFNADPSSGAVTFTHADSVFSWVRSKSFKIAAVLDTHVHADHLTAAPYLRARTAEAAAVSAGAAPATDFLDLMHRFGAAAAPAAAVSAAPAAPGTCLAGNAAVQTGIGANFPQIQATMSRVLNTGEKAAPGTEAAGDAIAYDVLLKDNDVIDVNLATGAVAVKHHASDAEAAKAAEAAVTGQTGCLRVMHTPGHTPACVSYVVYSTPSASAPDSSAAAGAVLVGDTVFAQDMGSARCDFPGGSVTDLWTSAQRILSLPQSTLVVSGHDYPEGKPRTFAPVATVAEQRSGNMHFRTGADAEGFAKMRAARDAQLAPPKLLVQSITWNIGAGRDKGAAQGGYAVSIKEFKDAISGGECRA